MEIMHKKDMRMVQTIKCVFFKKVIIKHHFLANFDSTNMQLTNLQKQRDSVMSAWTRISKNCFQPLVESMSRRAEAVFSTR